MDAALAGTSHSSAQKEAGVAGPSGEAVKKSHRRRRRHRHRHHRNDGGGDGSDDRRHHRRHRRHYHRRAFELDDSGQPREKAEAPEERKEHAHQSPHRHHHRRRHRSRRRRAQQQPDKPGGTKRPGESPREQRNRLVQRRDTLQRDSDHLEAVCTRLEHQLVPHEGDRKWRDAKARAELQEAARKEKLLERYRARDQRKAQAERAGASSRIDRNKKTRFLVLNKIAKVRERREHFAEAEAQRKREAARTKEARRRASDDGMNAGERAVASREIFNRLQRLQMTTGGELRPTAAALEAAAAEAAAEAEGAEAAEAAGDGAKPFRPKLSKRGSVNIADEAFAVVPMGTTTQTAVSLYASSRWQTFAKMLFAARCWRAACEAAREKRARGHAASKVKKAWGGFFNRKMARKHRQVMIPLLQKKGWVLSFKLRCARRRKLMHVR